MDARGRRGLMYRRKGFVDPPQPALCSAIGLGPALACRDSEIVSSRLWAGGMDAGRARHPTDRHADQSIPPRPGYAGRRLGENNADRNRRPAVMIDIDNKAARYGWEAFDVLEWRRMRSEAREITSSVEIRALGKFGIWCLSHHGLFDGHRQ